ncbi:MAG: hypothetical protein A3C79_02465 [Candidatus Taylorbacteria bacterium RIFCSPHIGHO2_02_FULL_45_28]|uniref:Death-on-curing protein n=1 Tax=Candidatus Taylorbacteria bacterium RIFCSPHIGHO2_12_FULL_45_16 TaxID=1802315 RepID=A0A1G2MXY6_9BACT|nr:MAG: hypothetical protein A2830_03270 [Candidatus Taylorbacteria bacterium RIFCSPHIGHO2_01_FULL_44_110]OHA25317.1 MAG: hypothetical protein A3C79_02465 [Candidatus Taylorbacteria bacterium RIFCSPHIGHO2_02_FULL_45_28]OHA28704.1 MAG: hypothetical protein A3F51_02930 [Candidatus Taylorbacteria bacterium RIFCSPHIGHO2_12_FULL_45_16]OHA32978.1 MAG: hypothetical protein A3A23_01110 [Candidatus Taylorbacteria bacterium RIFCSPLOWO2_01_FULL_45_59]OHA38468.1 MAG: hypothetical protein A3I98_00620 [Candi
MKKLNKNKQQKLSGDNIVLYANKNGKVELRADIKKDTMWASQTQIATVFQVDVRTINEHLKNIFRTRELTEVSVIRNFRITAADGKRYKVKFYNLDAIIAVGYRVNSKKATKFRIWATGILRDYLVNGHALNQRTLAASPEKIEGLHEVVALLESSKNPGRLKGKVIFKMTKEMVNRE